MDELIRCASLAIVVEVLVGALFLLVVIFADIWRSR